MTEALAALRREVCALHAELPRNGLVAWTSGNLSARVPGEPLMVIKASGIPYDELTPDHIVVCDFDGSVVEGDLAASSDAATHGHVYRELPEVGGVAYDDLAPEAMVVCDLYGEPIEGALAPSSDAATHGYVYRHMPELGGIVHTHSAYATAWAIRGEPIPCVMTAMADEFGGEIPVGPFALIGDDSIGRGIVETLSGHRSAAVLMRSHGVFTIGKDARAAVKAAVMCEDVARSVHLARQLGEPLPIAQTDIDRLYDRYQNVYGQPGKP